jgi:ribulose 1,5-bisphosphate synthetase/thiazole synthase
MIANGRVEEGRAVSVLESSIRFGSGSWLSALLCCKVVIEKWWYGS